MGNVCVPQKPVKQTESDGKPSKAQSHPERKSRYTA